MKIFSIVALVLLLSTKAFAVQEFNKTLIKIGNQAGDISYIYVSPAPAQGCLYNVLYASTATTFGKTTYATLLAAKLENRIITRVDYIKQTDGRCFMTLVELG